jgi:hypothetical protein
MTSSFIPPHCDSRVLHAPGECVHCDAYPELQELRSRWWGILFTGQKSDDPNMIPCPAEWRRSLAVINKWYGNVPTPLDKAGESSEQ